MSKRPNNRVHSILKSSRRERGPTGLNYHISVALFLCVEGDRVTHYRTDSTEHGGNMRLWRSCGAAAAWQAVLAETRAPQRGGTVCLQDFFFFYCREQTKYSSSIENWPLHRAAESTVQTDVVRTEKHATLPRAHGD